MRITEEQNQAIHRSIKNVLGSIPYQIFLFGSRIQDDLCGGDIDLALIVNKDEKSRVQALDLQLLVQIKKQNSIGDRKIDLKVISINDIEADPFLKRISKDWIQL